MGQEVDKEKESHDWRRRDATEWREAHRGGQGAFLSPRITRKAYWWTEHQYLRNGGCISFLRITLAPFAVFTVHSRCSTLIGWMEDLEGPCFHNKDEWTSVCIKWVTLSTQCGLKGWWTQRGFHCPALMIYCLGYFSPSWTSCLTLPRLNFDWNPLGKRYYITEPLN